MEKEPNESLAQQRHQTLLVLGELLRLEENLHELSIALRERAAELLASPPGGGETGEGAKSSRTEPP